MFFGKSKKRKSNVVGTPEYNEYEEQDNRQDIYDLQERMKKHGFEGGPGTNKDRWIYGDNVFDFDRPFGGAQEAWTISEDKYNKLKELLDILDSEEDADVAQEVLKDMKQQLDVGNEEDAKNQTVNNIVKGLKFGQYDK